jgi:hypothetical protein
MPCARADLNGDPAPLPTLLVLGPLGGQVELEIDQDVLGVGDDAQVDPDLTVLDLAEAAALWPRDAYFYSSTYLEPASQVTEYKGLVYSCLVPSFRVAATVNVSQVLKLQNVTSPAVLQVLL